MKTLRRLLLAAAMLLVPLAGAAQPGDELIVRNPALDAPMGTLPLMAWGPGTLAGAPGMMARLFPPTLIMQHQKELNLSENQQEAIKAELRDFQSRVVDVQWELQATQRELQTLMAEDRIDADAAAAAIDRVLAAENALKKLHLTLLISIRNLLEPEQIQKLEKRMHSFAWTLPAPRPQQPFMPAPPAHR